jgi:peptidoglycan/LPS O-acetylase OafA/YrhL
MPAKHDNNFDVLRLIAATSVWFGHCFILAGRTDPLTAHAGFMAFGQLGVAMFFVISGYFVTASYAQNHSLLVFLRNRSLRILPALVTVIALSVFALGPLTTSLGLHDYFARRATWVYLNGALIFPLHYDLPGVFQHNLLTAVNGSLWTLKQEVRCYLAIALMGVCGMLRGRTMLLLLLALLGVRLFGAIVNPERLLHMKWGDLNIAVQLGSLFAAGAALYLLRDRVPLKAGGLLGASLLAAASAWLPVDLGHMLFDMSFAYIVLCLGFARLPLRGRQGGKNDYSYGIYLYSFPMQQLTLHLMGGGHFVGFMAVSLGLTLICAALSWHCVEKPALRLKGG